MIRKPWTLLLPSILLVACGGDDGGNRPGAGGGGGGGGADCTQAECLSGSGDYWEVDRICLPGGCTDVGLRDEFGEIRRGAMLVGLQTESVDARTIRSAYVRILHPRDARGEAVDCDRILAAPEGFDDLFNVVGYYTTAIRSSGYVDFSGMLGPVAGLPVNDASTGYVVYIAMYSGDRDAVSHDPTGVLFAEGCLPGLVVADGEPANWGNPDAAHLFGTVVARPPR